MHENTPASGGQIRFIARGRAPGPYVPGSLFGAVLRTADIPCSQNFGVQGRRYAAPFQVSAWIRDLAVALLGVNAKMDNVGPRRRA
jgi:hypothetical protein